MEQEIKAFNEVLTVYYELLEIVGTAPCLWTATNNVLIKQFPLDIEFVVDVQSTTKCLNSHENWLLNEYFFSQDFLDATQKVQFTSIQIRIGKLFIERKIYPIALYNRRY